MHERRDDPRGSADDAAAGASVDERGDSLGESESHARPAALYPCVLGSEWSRLDPVLQAFHGTSAPRTAHGEFTVWRRSGRLAGWVADRLGLPARADRVPLRLRIEPLPAPDGCAGVSGELWTRYFGEVCLRTEQRALRGRLVESVGRMEITLDVRVEGAELTFRSIGARLAGVPIPGWLAPRVRSRAAPQAGGFHVCVRLGVPGFDPLVEYSGDVTP